MSEGTGHFRLPQVQANGSRARGARAAMGTAVVATGFCATVIVALVVNFSRERAGHPLVEMRIPELKAQLAQRPDDDRLKEAIREADLEMRRGFFSRRGFAGHGSYLLLGGAIVLVLALKSAGTLSPGNVVLPEKVDPWRNAAVIRRGVAMAGLAVVGSFLAMVLLPGAEIPREVNSRSAEVDGGRPSPQPSPGVPGEGVRAPSYPTDEQLKGNWPGFRGASGVGVMEGASAPTEWDGESGKNILWKAEMPLTGHNSPIVWGNRVFVSGATETARAVFCYDGESGKLLWRQGVASTAPAPKISEDTGFAAPTMATDGQRVIALFATGDLAAFDFEGKPLWTKALGKADSPYGLASSLRMWRDRVIVQLDQGGEEVKGSALIAFDSVSGKELWRTSRPVRASWSSPVLIQTESDEQIVTAADPWVIAYEPEGGKELWRAKAVRGDVAPSPAYADGIVYVAQESSDLVAIRANGKGDVTGTHIAWKSDDRMPDITSPLATKEYVFVVLSDGMISCYNAKSGKFIWEHELGTQCKSSPVLVGKNVYQLDDEGTMHIFELGPQYKEVGTAKIGEEAEASPGFAGGKVYIRGKEHLYCIGEKRGNEN